MRFSKIKAIKNRYPSLNIGEYAKRLCMKLKIMLFLKEKESGDMTSAHNQ